MAIAAKATAHKKFIDFLFKEYPETKKSERENKIPDMIGTTGTETTAKDKSEIALAVDKTILEKKSAIKEKGSIRGSYKNDIAMPKKANIRATLAAGIATRLAIGENNGICLKYADNGQKVPILAPMERDIEFVNGRIFRGTDILVNALLIKIIPIIAQNESAKLHEYIK